MAQINVNHLTFSYEGSADFVFDQASFSIDTNWKLGFIGRNGKGKTTFLKLLLGEYEYSGTITASTAFGYFPYPVIEEYWDQPAAGFLEEWKPGCELWRVILELNLLGAEGDILYRPFHSLSFGERTKVMLAVLFSGENDFLLIDEPTNHLDQESRKLVKDYLGGKKGFILVSHDRDLLDACIDHVLVLNRSSIQVQAGNFSSWWENKQREDGNAQAENEKHLKEIAKLQNASRQARRWAEKSENTKIGHRQQKANEHDPHAFRAYIGAKTKKMQSRVKQMEQRMEKEVKEKEGLLADIERPADLKMTPLVHDKNRLLEVRDYAFRYPDSPRPLFTGLNFELNRGDRVFLKGDNGCGKSSLIRAVLKKAGQPEEDEIKWEETGILQTAPGLAISYISQDTRFLKGTIKEFCRKRQLDESLFCAVLRQLDLERAQFGKKIEDFSQGQKKKVLIASSLVTPAHLYVWDEPLNYIDIFSRIQLENVLLEKAPSMLVVEHDERFRERIATKVIEIRDR